MSELQPEGGVGEQLTEVQQRFVEFVVAKAGDNFEETRAATIYNVQNDLLVNFLVAIHERTPEGTTDAVTLEYYERLESNPLYELSLDCNTQSIRALAEYRAQYPLSDKGQYSVSLDGDTPYDLLDDDVLPMLDELYKSDSEGRLVVDSDTTKQYVERRKQSEEYYQRIARDTGLFYRPAPPSAE